VASANLSSSMSSLTMASPTEKGKLSSGIPAPIM
jgi:hypothetical protein